MVAGHDSYGKQAPLLLSFMQVTEQPPVSAAHAENEHFTYDIVSAPATKFQGNSLEVYPKGE